MPQQTPAERQGISSIEGAARFLHENPGLDQNLWSPANAAEIQGVLWFVMLQRAIDCAFVGRRATIVLDCGQRAELAVEALRLGIRAISLEAPDLVAAKVAAIAKNCGAKLLDRPDAFANG
jgi:hypothetical protein